ncbi:hypothetical protein BZA77DRAFT_71975 [Pyronema omphalodes]|nr:hypothetical protein BZA77DRAFT_71975 [Pyronema omphalodes]
MMLCDVRYVPIQDREREIILMQEARSNIYHSIFFFILFINVTYHDTIIPYVSFFLFFFFFFLYLFLPFIFLLVVGGGGAVAN